MNGEVLRQDCDVHPDGWCHQYTLPDQSIVRDCESNDILMVWGAAGSAIAEAKRYLDRLMTERGKRGGSLEMDFVEAESHLEMALLSVATIKAMVLAEHQADDEEGL